jgi:hypothetical protein
MSAVGTIKSLRRRCVPSSGGFDADAMLTVERTHVGASGALTDIRFRVARPPASEFDAKRES